MDEPIDFPLDLLPGNYDEQYVQYGTMPSSVDAPVAECSNGSWSGNVEAPQVSHPAGYQQLIASNQSACFGAEGAPWSADSGGMPLGQQPPLQAWEAETGNHPWPVSLELERRRQQVDESVDAMSGGVAPDEDPEERAREE